ncbi:MAG: hypothetical protein GEU78_09585 [Actinobacteria bacterium]|nr:hypothetical protein [Actinomycetota bacterium]
MTEQTPREVVTSAIPVDESIGGVVTHFIDGESVWGHPDTLSGLVLDALDAAGYAIVRKPTGDAIEAACEAYDEFDLFNDYRAHPEAMAAALAAAEAADRDGEPVQGEGEPNVRGDSEPGEYVIPRETLKERLKRDGDLWKIAFEEGRLAGRNEADRGDEPSSFTCEGCGRALPCRHCSPVPLDDPELVERIARAVGSARWEDGDVIVPLVCEQEQVARAVVDALKQDGGGDRLDEDAEQFCARCFAGLESSEHHEKCVEQDGGGE